VRLTSVYYFKLIWVRNTGDEKRDENIGLLSSLGCDRPGDYSGDNPEIIAH